MRTVRAGLGLVALVAGLAVAAVAGPRAPGAATEAREVFNALNGVRVDRAQVYYVRDLHLRKDAVRLSFLEGKLALLEAFEGRVTGAVFTGTGRAIAVPRDPVERRSLAWYLGTPLLDQPFTRAYLRFTDDTAEQLLLQIRAAEGKPADDPSFVEEWNPTVANLNNWHSLRVLLDRLSMEPQPYFYAGLAGAEAGTFDVLVDDRREEQVLIGQSRLGEAGYQYDVWASFPRANAPTSYRAAFSPISYVISTSIHPDLLLEGQTTLRFRGRRAGERVVAMGLSRFLKVQSVTDGQGRSLEFFQNEALETRELAERGNDNLYVVLPEASHEGTEMELRIGYQGRVISDAGNNVYFVGDRGSWYPSLAPRDPGVSGFATFDLTFRWPRRLTLVATGKRSEIREETCGSNVTKCDGGWRVGRWQTEAPAPVAGFNLGAYVTHTVGGGDLKVEVHANRQLEQALQERFRRQVMMATGLAGPHIWPQPSRSRPVVVSEVPTPPGPDALLSGLGEEVRESIRFYEKYLGPFPFSTLAVSPIPGTFGQGWPGLLYLSTLSFLSPTSQVRAGVAPQTQEQLNELLPFHEVAHQWWGNTIGGASYRDYWIHEAMASYLSLLYAESRNADEKFLRNWLDHFRDDLVTKEPGQDQTTDEAGPLMLGTRLESSKTANAYLRILYGKGPWIIHMLRMMMRDPDATVPDARFQQLLRGLLESHRYRPVTTADLQRAVEKLMTPGMDLEGNRSMEWFFHQWIRRTGIPRYSVTFEAKPSTGGQGFVVTGTLKQEGVPETFTAAIPLYVPRAVGKPVLLGTVITSGTETKFQFTTRSQPRRLLIDPNRTLLCVTE